MWKKNTRGFGRHKKTFCQTDPYDRQNAQGHGNLCN